MQSFFFWMVKYIIYKRIKSQVLHQKEKIKTHKTPKEKPLTPSKSLIPWQQLLKEPTPPAILQRTNTANSDQLGTR